jgi:hypothetical protein
MERSGIKSTNPDIDYTMMTFDPKSEEDFFTWIESRPPHIDVEKWFMAISNLCIVLNESQANVVQ